MTPVDEQPIYTNPVMQADGSHRGMNAGQGPAEPRPLTAALARRQYDADLAGGQVEGVDTSHWNGTINPTVGQVRYGVKLWAHKATEGTTYIDPTFRKAQTDMRAAGIKYRLWYHFPRNNLSIKDQVDHFLRTIGPLWLGEAALLDDEAATGLGCLTIAQAREWHERVETAIGRPTAQYTGGYVRNLADPFYHWDATVLREGLFGHRPNMFASYNAETVARGNARGKPWDVWQWTSSAVLPGIQSGGITVTDRDRVDFPLAYDAACGYTVEPTPEPVPPTPIPIPTPVPPVPVPVPPPPSQEDFDTMIYSPAAAYDSRNKDAGGPLYVHVPDRPGSRTIIVAPGKTGAQVIITPIGFVGRGHLRWSGNGVEPDFSAAQFWTGYPPMPLGMWVHLNGDGALDVWVEGEDGAACDVIISRTDVNG